jgi:hypothetical protein
LEPKIIEKSQFQIFHEKKIKFQTFFSNFFFLG